jgi:hypothetical protein
LNDSHSIGVIGRISLVKDCAEDIFAVFPPDAEIAVGIDISPHNGVPESNEIGGIAPSSGFPFPIICGFHSPNLPTLRFSPFPLGFGLGFALRFAVPSWFACGLPAMFYGI